MNMNWIDWSVVAAILAFLCIVAWRTSIYMRSVADFLAANRTAGRYLIAFAEGTAGMGAISIIALFQLYYEAGFSSMWWGNLQNLIAVIIAVTGFVYYRFRRTRAMTIGQFFEIVRADD